MTIFIPVDGSDHSLEALKVIKARAAHDGINSPVHVFYAMEQVPARVCVVEGPGELKAYYDEQAAFVQRKVDDILKDSKVNYDFSYGLGNIVDTIVARAEEVEASIIVMGSRGQGAMRGLLFGSVSNNVIARTHVPVLILRGPMVDHHRPNLRVGIAVDGSEYGLNAAHYALLHRQFFGNNPEFELIHVCPSLSVSVMSALSGGAAVNYAEGELEQYRKDRMHEACDPMLKLFDAVNVKPSLVALEGSPGHAIAEYAEPAGLDVIVMGSYGYGNFKAAMLGSVAMTIASASDKPLLIVR